MTYKFLKTSLSLFLEPIPSEFRQSHGFQVWKVMTFRKGSLFFARIKAVTSAKIYLPVYAPGERASSRDFHTGSIY